MSMNKRPINTILDIITERKPSIKETYTYRETMDVLAKRSECITYAEKMMVRDNLRMLCIFAGLSYERLIMKVCRS